MFDSVLPSSPLPLDFHWNCATPFHISPQEGTVGPQEKCRQTATFKPLVSVRITSHLLRCMVIQTHTHTQAACVYSVTATCRYGEEPEYAKEVRLEGTGQCRALV